MLPGSPQQTCYLFICWPCLYDSTSCSSPADALAPHPSLFSPTELSYFINIPLHLFATPTLIFSCMSADFACRAASPGLHFCSTDTVSHSQTLSASSQIFPSHILNPLRGWIQYIQYVLSLPHEDTLRPHKPLWCTVQTELLVQLLSAVILIMLMLVGHTV